LTVSKKSDGIEQNCISECIKLLNVLSEKRDFNKVDVAFSGGLDSLIVSKVFSDKISSLYTAGIKQCSDFKRAAHAAHVLGMKHTVLEMSPEEVLEVASEVAEMLRTADPVVVSFTVPVWRTLRASEADTVLWGQGADELFGGYARYLEMPDPEPRMRRDLDLALERSAALERAATNFRKHLYTPYLEREFMEFAQEVPMELKIKGGIRKYLLRAVASAMGIPEELTKAPKKAAQYGSGVMKVLRREASRRGLTVGELLAEML